MQYYRDCAWDPNLALAGLRIELEILANNLADGFNLSNPRFEPVARLLSRLVEHGAITNEQLQLTKRIVRLCNQAVHGSRVTREEADEVIDLASVLRSNNLLG